MLVGINLFADSSKRAQMVLDEVWNQVSSRHFNIDFKKKYQKLYDKHKTEILKSKNDASLSKNINKLLMELGQSHIILMPPVGAGVSKAMAKIRKSTAPKKNGSSGKRRRSIDAPADTGIIVSQTDNKICVIRVRKNSPAAKAGIKMGDVIITINGFALSPRRQSYLGWPIIVRALLSGQPGSKVTLAIENSKNKIRKVTLKRQLNGEKWFKFGVLPRSYSDFYATVLPGNIGYVNFTAFTPPMIMRFRQAILGKLRNVKGLIIDMRGNVGGMLIYPQWLAAWCCPEQVFFGKLIMKGVPLSPQSFPQTQCFKGPLAVLIDKYAYSCAEIFPAGMQDCKKAKLFGTTTSGKCLPSVFLKLPSGFRLQTITGNITRKNGEGIEKIGVKPDVKVILSLKSLQAGKDNVIEAAREYLLKK